VLPKRGRPFRVRCDWIKKGVGGVLLQEDDAGVERVVAYGSRSCNGAESRYSSFQGELLAAVYFVRLWRQYLYGERFQLESDHRPLQWILTNFKLTGKLARWALMLSEFDFEVIHKPGVDNEMDCLSKFPQAAMRDSTGVRQEGDLEEAAVLVWLAASCLAWAGSGGRLQVGGAALEAKGTAPVGGAKPETADARQGAVGVGLSGGRSLKKSGAAGGCNCSTVSRAALRGRQRQLVRLLGWWSGSRGVGASVWRGRRLQGRPLLLAAAGKQSRWRLSRLRMCGRTRHYLLEVEKLMFQID
jgi:hypothetical protein